MTINHIAANSISRLLFFVALAGFLSCQSDDKLTGVAAGAVGRYVVTAYIASGDTLFSVLPGPAGYRPGINKIGVTNFTITLEATGSDQLTIKTDYWRKGSRFTLSKEVFVRLTNADYQFSLLKNRASSDYEGSVGRFTGFFYERTTGGIAIPLADSPINPNPSPLQDVVIIAQPGR